VYNLDEVARKKLSLIKDKGIDLLKVKGDDLLIYSSIIPTFNLSNRR
jgi:hypothetical protein